MERDSVSGDALVTLDTRAFERAAGALDPRTVDRIGGRALAAPMRQMANGVRRTTRAALMERHKFARRMRDHIRPRVYGPPNSLERWWAVRSTGVASNLVVGGARPHQYGGTLMHIWTRGTVLASGRVSRRGAGVVAFTRHVSHPGYAGDPFFKRGIAAAQPLLDTQSQKAVDNLAAGLARRMEGKS